MFNFRDSMIEFLIRLNQKKKLENYGFGIKKQNIMNLMIGQTKKNKKGNSEELRFKDSSNRILRK